MAHQIKLDVYTLKLKKKRLAELVPFNEFSNLTREDGANTFEDFISNYVNSFDNKFVVQDVSGKALSLRSEDLKFASRQRIIYGIIEGGVTGIGSKIKNRDNSGDEGSFHVTAEKVNAIPYYFLMWIPNDSNIGLLIVQGFSDRQISEAFKEHLKKFFSQEISGTSLWIDNYVPVEVIEKMKKNATINTITVRKYHLPSSKGEKLLGIKYSKDKDVTIEVKISGLKYIPEMAEKINQFVMGKVTQLIDVSPLEEVGFDDNHEILVKFEHNGKTAIGKSTNNFQISPSYYVEPTDIQINENKHPTINSIHAYTLSFLEALKNQIGYKKT